MKLQPEPLFQNLPNHLLELHYARLAIDIWQALYVESLRLCP